MATPICAQQTTGEIQGTVKDQTGAVVPNVTVNIQGQTVGFNRTVQTDSDGVFHAREIPPGTYTVSIEATSGFAAQKKENVLVTIGNATPADFIAGTTVGAVVNVSSGNEVAIDPTETKAQSNISLKADR